MRTRRLTRAAALAVLLPLALAGCLKVDLDLALQPDDTIDGSLLFAVENSLAEQSGQDAESLAEDMRDDLIGSEDGPQNATVETYDDGDYVGTTLTFEGEALDLFGNAMGADGLTVTREDDEFVVAGVLDLTEAGGEVAETFTEPVDVRVAVTFPGEVSDHNGSLDGTTVVWTPQPGDRIELSARGDATGTSGGGLSQPLLLLIGLVAVAGVAGIIALVARGRRPADQPVAPVDLGAAYGAPGGYTGPHPPPADPTPPPEEAGDAATGEERP